jgi:hypothetical protein
MGVKRKYKGNGKSQFGGLISSLFGGMDGEKGSQFIGEIGNALKGFSNEPALKGFFDQSDTMLKGFKEQLSDSQLESMGGESSLKPMFDLVSLFSGGMGGTPLFADGGVVEEEPMTKGSMSKIKKRYKGFLKDMTEGIVDMAIESEKKMAIQQFNMTNTQKGVDESQIIPGINRGNGGVRLGEQMQRGGVPVSSRGQYDFPGQPVIVPTPDGRITMQGVNQDILALQDGGATILPANSGMHQLNPGEVMEIPLPPKKKPSSRMKSKKKDDKKGLSTRIPTVTSRRFHNRNEKQTMLNRRGNVGYPFGNKY